MRWTCLVLFLIVPTASEKPSAEARQAAQRESLRKWYDEAPLPYDLPDASACFEALNGSPAPNDFRGVAEWLPWISLTGGKAGFVYWGSEVKLAPLDDEFAPSEIEILRGCVACDPFSYHCGGEPVLLSVSGAAKARELAYAIDWLAGEGVLKIYLLVLDAANHRARLPLFVTPPGHPPGDAYTITDADPWGSWARRTATRAWVKPSDSVQDMVAALARVYANGGFPQIVIG